MKKNILKMLLISLTVGVFIQFFGDHDFTFYIRNLETGNIQKKLEAGEYLGKNKIIEGIPLLILNIDNFKSSTYTSSPKAPETVSCISTFALQEIIGRLYDNTCNLDGSKTKEMIEESIKNWRTWYSSEYPSWLEEQKKKNEKT